MPIFIVETAAMSPIREYWRVEAASPEEAAETYGDKGQCLYDEVLGEEEGRQVSEVHPYGALAGFLAAESARKEAPAMLAALRETLRDLDAVTGVDDHGSDTIGCMENRIRAILSRIDGAAPAPTAPAPVAPDAFAAHALNTLTDCEAWFANGGNVDGVFFDDATMLDRVRESLALAAPTAQPAGVWRIVSGEPDTPRALYWSNCDGWGGIAGSDAFSQAERETLNLPIGGRWWFDSDDEPAAPSGEAGDHCASCGAEEGESHGAQCETRGFAVGVDARRLDTGALRTVAGDDAAWLEATASRDGGEG